MTTAANILAQYLSPLFSVDDPIFRSLIANPDGVPAPTPVKPMEYNIGVIANVLEWLRKQATGDGSYVDQIYLTRAKTKWLNLTAQVYIGLLRFEGETDTDYVARIQKYITAPKISPASMIICLRDFSTTEPVILEGAADTAFADVSFSDQYRVFKVITPGPEFDNFVQPALAGPVLGGGPFFLVLLTGTNPNDYNRVFDIINRWRAAGTTYEIQITP